jgi:hypothetical protein
VQRQAAGTQVSTHGTRLWTLARALTPHDRQARAAVLAVLAVATRNPRRVSRSDPEGWLLAVLARVTAPPSPVVVAVGAEARGLDELGAPERDVAVLCLLGGLDVARAARVLGRSRAAVARQHRVAGAARLPVVPAPEPLPAGLLDGPVPPPPRVRAPRQLRLGALVGVAALLVAVAAATASIDRTRGPGPGDRSTPLRSSVAAALGQAALALSAADRQVASRAGFTDSGDLVLDQHLARCAAAVVDTGAGSLFPPVSTWSARRTEVDTAGLVSTVNGAFVCVTGPARVWVSATRGVDAGGVELLAAGPDLFAVRNPDRAAIEVRSGRDGSGVSIASTNAAIVVVPYRVGATAANLRLTVTRDGVDTYDGPLPDPGFTAVRRSDTALPAPDLPGPGDPLLARCLAEHPDVPEPDAWRTATALRLDDPARTLEVVGAPGAVLLCTGADEPPGRTTVLVAPVADPPSARSLDPVPLPGSATVVDGSSTVVLAVDPRATRLEVSGSPVPVRCVVRAGHGVCVAPGRGAGDTPVTGLATAYDSSDAVVAGPTQLP